MKMNKIFGFMLTLTISTQVMAYGPDEPPFDTLVCAAGNTSVQVEVHHGRRHGLAVIKSNGINSSGSWRWQAEPQGTRLTGYHHLTVTANGQDGLRSFYFHTLYTPYGQLRSGWVEMPGFSGATICQIAAKPHIY